MRPGEKAKQSSQVEIVGPRGGKTGEKRTVVRGEPLPPTPKPGQGFAMVDLSKNGAGKK